MSAQKIRDYLDRWRNDTKVVTLPPSDDGLPELDVGQQWFVVVDGKVKKVRVCMMWESVVSLVEDGNAFSGYHLINEVTWVEKINEV